LKQKRSELPFGAADRQVLDPATILESNGGMSNVKSLNVLFMYNGHSFDAHEILGVPPGSNAKTIDEAYRRLQSSLRPESREFVETAYRVLKIEQNRLK
jgi:hypothetical protein